MVQNDAAWLDAQYNNRARVPDHAQIFRRWSETSAFARERLAGRLDLAYGDQPGETLDVFPAEKAGSPIASLDRLLPEADFPSLDAQPPLKIAVCRKQASDTSR